MSRKVILSLALLIFLWTGAYFSARPLHGEKSLDFWQQERATAVISSPDIIPFLLGFEITFAHFLWIRTVLYAGANMLGDNDGRWLGDMIEAVNMLHPQFFPPYEFAAVMLPQITGDFERSRIILENGLARVRDRDSRMLYFYLGWIYYSHFQDYVRAASLFAAAARFPNSPTHWATLSATSLAQGGHAEMGIMFLLDLFESSDNPQVKRAVLARIKSIYEENRESLPFELPREFLEQEI